MTNAQRSSKNERRDAAREKAREQRLRQQRREKRNRVLLQASIGVVIVAIVAVVAVIIVNSVRPPGPGPRNMANGGITIAGKDLTAVTTGAASPGATTTPEPTLSSGKVLIQAYEDFGCPVCQAFEQQFGGQIKQLVSSGAAEIQYHPVAFLDHSFTDQNYSTRAANAAAAIANYSPNAFYKFHSIMYETSVQPKEGTAGLTDDRLIAIAKQAGATNMTQIEQAIRDQTFKNWVGARTDEFLSDSGSLKGVDFSKRLGSDGKPSGPGTPTLIVNGQYWDSAATPDFGAFVTSVGGALSTATPTPTPSASASPTPTASN
ncbi:DsbA family protein [Amnibacterium kyonggiense]|uniref:Thioredoxin-like protein n=1 Tax=Amnibacterium kyonggiense TaxID=595671 RepID=A0A4R7FRG2_9MICO|nr:thioredoxin domain-containing protein [Amnibacterium kyonggiense]TDS80401.1 thioredoxin-like protein [Amnibacterium kyonggiense]